MASTTMKAVIYEQYGLEEDLLKIGDVPKPTPKRNEVLVKVSAVGLNPSDIKRRKGDLKSMDRDRNKFPKIPGSDFAGEVVEVGAKVTKFKVGDKVYGYTNFLTESTAAEYVAVAEPAIAKAPEGLSMEDAASFPCAVLTAYQALKTHWPIKEGDDVLVNGASGGVGNFAVQIAKALGATVTGVCGAGNVDWVKELGADNVIDYGSEDFTKGEAKYNLVYDCVSSRSFKECKNVIKPGGAYVDLWPKSSTMWAQAATKFFFGRRKCIFYFVQPKGVDLEGVTELVQSNKVKTTVEEVYDANDMAKAFTKSSEGHVKGKLVVKMNFDS